MRRRRVPVSFSNCVLPWLVEVPKTATRESLGSISLSSSSLLPDRSAVSEDRPVIFPQDRARLATKPLPIGSTSCAMTIGIVDVACLAARVVVGPVGNDDVDIETHYLGHERGKPIKFPVSRSIFNENVFALDVTKLAQSLPEGFVTICDCGKRLSSYNSNAKNFRWLLRLGCKAKRQKMAPRAKTKIFLTIEFLRAAKFRSESKKN